MPTLNRRQSGRRNGLTRAQAEAGVMPGTAHRLTYHQAFAERATVVGALGVNRKHLRRAAGEKNRIRAHMTHQHGAVRKEALRDSGREIGAAGLRCVTHGNAPYLRAEE
jgi:hypothetical protein